MRNEKSKVEIAALRSRLLGREVEYCAVLPRNHPVSDELPVLYLLHGLFGRFDNWLTNTKIVEYARDSPFLIVCPEGADGWWTDTANRENHFYERYIFEELIPAAESKFNARARRETRAVAGLSMGGYGAFKFAFRRPEMFSFAASFSGAFHAAEISRDARGEIWAELSPSIREAFGEADEKQLAENDLFKIAESFPASRIKELPFFYFDCGAEDAEEASG